MKWKQTFLKKRELENLPLADLPLKKSQGKFFKQKFKKSIKHQKEKQQQSADR